MFLLLAFAFGSCICFLPFPAAFHSSSRPSPRDLGIRLSLKFLCETLPDPPLIPFKLLYQTILGTISGPASPPPVAISGPGLRPLLLEWYNSPLFCRRWLSFRLIPSSSPSSLFYCLLRFCKVTHAGLFGPLIPIIASFMLMHASPAPWALDGPEGDLE